MSRRELNTPLILWVAALCVAVNIHMGAGCGGDYVAKLHDDHLALSGFGASAREKVRLANQVIEVSSLDTPAPPDPPAQDEDPQVTIQKEKDKELEKEKAKEQPQPPPEKKPEAQEPLVVKKPDEAKPPPPVKLDDKRIAVKQHSQKNQEDNPNANFIADEANKVDQETVAQQTSHDQDDPNPTPGGNHANSDKRVGDSEKNKIADSEDHPGEKNRGPGEKGTEFDVQHDPPTEKPMGPVAVQAPPSQQPPKSGGDNRQPTPQPAQPNQAPTPPGAPQQPSEQNPQVATSDNGGWSWNPLKSGPGAANDKGPGTTTNPGGSAPRSPAILGLGGRTAPGQINLNLNQNGVVAVVGQDQLRKLREADGERRKSEHRGSWVASNFERWRNAIENYVSTVKPGNQTALNTAAVPFASYLNGMHNRIHPIFADTFLGSLDGLPATHPLSNMKLVTHLEIVLTRDGHVVKMGVVKTSGITSFDVAALDSVQRASPFGSAPSAIVSPDNKVYLHWEFYRDEVFACSTMFARPYLLNVPAAPPSEPPGPKGPAPAKERGAPTNTRDVREGLLPHHDVHKLASR